MNIFGVGPMEMGIIAVAALLIFGPGRLPEVMGQAGRAVRDFRRMTAELTGEFEKTIAEAKDIGQSLTSEVGAMKSEVTSVTESVKRDLGGTKPKAKPTSSTAKAGKVGSTTTSGASKTTETKKKTTGNGRKPAATTASEPAPTPKTHPRTGSSVSDAVVVASKDDPLSDFSLFTAEPAQRERRVRRAVPTAIVAQSDSSHADRTVTDVSAPLLGREADNRLNGADPLSRARQRRATAGYSRRSA
ncbi:MAG: twin-arginine translocase TatA/TatE family subunit [Chloroflexota bacterium]|nr:twin-arginine translocase TatA/TatE family subunit [Chloroflexota bacterium]